MSEVQSLVEDQIDGGLALTMLEQSPQCIKLLDQSGRLCFMSENGQQLMEIDDFTAIDGTEWWKLWPEKSQATLRNAVAAARGGMMVVFEAACPTARGKMKHWRVRVSRVEGGELDGMIIAASEDVSDQVELQDAREQLELDNAALRRFARFVAHDLRGPIRHHKILAELIASDPDMLGQDSEVTEFANEINESASSLLGLLDGLEGLHAVSSDDISDRKICTISSLAEKAAGMKGASSVLLDLDCDDLTIHANPSRMISVLWNLFENADKYGATDGQWNVRLTADILTDGTLEIVFSDNGAGFGPDRLEDVFQPLVRQANSLGTAGSGLGLALAEQIIRHEGGSISILRDHPKAQDGAIVQIILPIVGSLKEVM
jgi:signal transduction histidine kinase